MGSSREFGAAIVELFEFFLKKNLRLIDFFLNVCVVNLIYILQDEKLKYVPFKVEDYVLGYAHRG